MDADWNGPALLRHIAVIVSVVKVSYFLGELISLSFLESSLDIGDEYFGCLWGSVRFAVLLALHYFIL